MRRLVRSVRSIGETLYSSFSISFKPLMSSLFTDAKDNAGLNDLMSPRDHKSDKLFAYCHEIRSTPGHVDLQKGVRALKGERFIAGSPIIPVYGLPILPVCTANAANR